MKIECPSCHLAGKANELEFPPEGRNFECPRCKMVLWSAPFCALLWYLKSDAIIREFPDGT
jgi:hypothetical protein